MVQVHKERANELTGVKEQERGMEPKTDKTRHTAQDKKQVLLNLTSPKNGGQNIKQTKLRRRLKMVLR